MKKTANQSEQSVPMLEDFPLDVQAIILRVLEQVSRRRALQSGAEVRVAE